MSCVTHHLACECREAEFEAVREKLRQCIDYGPSLRGATDEYHLRKRIEELEKELKFWKSKASERESDK